MVSPKTLIPAPSVPGQGPIERTWSLTPTSSLIRHFPVMRLYRPPIGPRHTFQAFQAYHHMSGFAAFSGEVRWTEIGPVENAPKPPPVSEACQVNSTTVVRGWCDYGRRCRHYRANGRHLGPCDTCRRSCCVLLRWFHWRCDARAPQRTPHKLAVSLPGDVPLSCFPPHPPRIQEKVYWVSVSSGDPTKKRAIGSISSSSNTSLSYSAAGGGGSC